ncbi:uncharacterized protein LOC120334960 [Styela clava]
MASSLEVMRQHQRITSSGMTPPSHYPIPPSAQRRLLSPKALVGSQTPQYGQQNNLLPVGMPGRHSWTAMSSPTSSLLSNRLHRLNLRLSAPTPGEEELCRHWMQNSAKYSRRNNEELTRSSNFPANEKRNLAKTQERPRTVQTPPNHPYKDLLSQRSAEKRKVVVNVTSPNQECVTSSDSDRITSPTTSQRSSGGLRKPVNKFPLRRPSVSSYDRGGESRGNSPAGYKTDLSGNRQSEGMTQPRPPSARPSEARWRNRIRTSHSPLSNTRTNSAGNPRDQRRWSLNDTIMNQQNDSKDDDSAYSSSRDITVNIEKTPNNPNTPVGTPPRSAPNLRNDNFPSSTSKLDASRSYGSKVLVSGQDGRSVLYYHHNKANQRQSEAEESHILRHNTATYCHLLPLRHKASSQQRPKTQPAMNSQRARDSLKRKGTTDQRQQLIENAETKLMQRIMPNTSLSTKEDKTNSVEYHVGPKFYPISLGDYDAINKQRRSITSNQESVMNYVDPEVGQRIVQWLADIEQSPEVYYGFETDILKTHE